MLSIIFGTLAAKAKVKRTNSFSRDDGIVEKKFIPTSILLDSTFVEFEKTRKFKREV